MRSLILSLSISLYLSLPAYVFLIYAPLLSPINYSSSVTVSRYFSHFLSVLPLSPSLYISLPLSLSLSVSLSVSHLMILTSLQIFLKIYCLLIHVISISYSLMNTYQCKRSVYGFSLSLSLALALSLSPSLSLSLSLSPAPSLFIFFFSLRLFLFAGFF